MVVEAGCKSMQVRTDTRTLAALGCDLSYQHVATLHVIRQLRGQVDLGVWPFIVIL